MSLLQGFPFRFVVPDRVMVDGTGARYLWQPSMGWFYGGGVGSPPFLLLELAGQTAEVWLRHHLSPERDRRPLRLAALDQVVYAPPPDPMAELLVTVRLEAATGRIFRTACLVTAADGQVYLQGRLTHFLAD